MKQLALLIGNSAYPESPLTNASNDARDLSSRLQELGFETVQEANALNITMDVRLTEFGAKLAGYEVGLFFFAGHGMQISGENYLTAVDTNFSTDVNAKHSSLPLNKVIDTMEAAGPRMSVIILDACRTNPYERRWRAGASRGLAPVYAPKGMIVAYATSPGQVAEDGFGRNGAYTSAILQHIAQQNVSIETFFKRVRNTLSASTNGRQISWEHTSLMGEYYFNNSVTSVAGVTDYSDAALADSSFSAAGGVLHAVINDLKSHNWYAQNPAVAAATPDLIGTATKDECFVLGRNLYQAACGDANSASAFVASLKASLAKMPASTGFHILNGMLFEIYFDRLGRFRNFPKARKIDEVLALEEDIQHAESFRFIQQELLPHRERLFYLPGTLALTCFDVVLVRHAGSICIEKICHEAENVLYQDGIGYFVLREDSFLTQETRDSLVAKVSTAAAVPRARLKVSFVGPESSATSFRAPWETRMLRNAPV
jgi:hypothetical protein